MQNYDLIMCVVNHNQGSKALKIAKKNGVKGGTICLGRGTVKNRILEALELADVRKEIVFMAAESEHAHTAVNAVYEEMSMKKPNHGIIFSISLVNVISSQKSEYREKSETEAQTMYSAVYTVVDKGKAEEVIDAAKSAGARGGTIINARGSGIHDTGMVFNMAIEPEKEIVLILAETNLVRGITAAVREALRIDEPGKGIIFTAAVSEVYGLMK